jgi:hypothetical protein
MEAAMPPRRNVRVAVNGYGVIGKRVAEAIAMIHIGCGDRLADAHRHAQRL